MPPEWDVERSESARDLAEYKLHDVSAVNLRSTHRRLTEALLGMLELIARVGIEIGCHAKGAVFVVDTETANEFDFDVYRLTRMLSLDSDMLEPALRSTVRQVELLTKLMQLVCFT